MEAFIGHLLQHAATYSPVRVLPYGEEPMDMATGILKFSVGDQVPPLEP